MLCPTFALTWEYRIGVSLILSFCVAAHTVFTPWRLPWPLLSCLHFLLLTWALTFLTTNKHEDQALICRRKAQSWGGEDSPPGWLHQGQDSRPQVCTAPQDPPSLTGSGCCVWTHTSLIHEFWPLLKSRIRHGQTLRKSPFPFLERRTPTCLK